MYIYVSSLFNEHLMFKTNVKSPSPVASSCLHSVAQNVPEAKNDDRNDVLGLCEATQMLHDAKDEGSQPRTATGILNQM